MPTRRVLRIDNDEDKVVLKTRTRPVKFPNPGLKQLAKDMLETMHIANGVGLAAPQIGLSHRIAVVYIPPEVEEHEDGTTTETVPEQIYVLINPEVVKASDEEEVGLEGCLSLPGWYGDVPRAAWVTVDYQGLDGKRYRIRKADGLLGRALQHEIDHLDGILFTERIRDLSTLKDYSKEKEAETESAEH